MESDAKFDLNAGIEEWRQSALRAGIPPAELEELEDHIRSSVSAAIDSGSDPDGSFSRVVVSMGRLRQLGRDYRLENRARPWFLRWAMLLPAMIAFSVIAQIGGMLIGSSLAHLVWDGSTTIWLSKIFASFPMGFAFVMTALLVAPEWRVGVACASVAVVCVWAVALLSAGSAWVAWMGVSGVLGAFGAMGMRGIVSQSFLDKLWQPSVLGPLTATMMIALVVIFIASAAAGISDLISSDASLLFAGPGTSLRMAEDGVYVSGGTGGMISGRYLWSVALAFALVSGLGLVGWTSLLRQQWKAAS